MLLFFRSVGVAPNIGRALELDSARPITPLGGTAPISAPNRVARARYMLEVAWEAHAKGVFILGVSTIGGTDVLGVSPFDVTFTGEHDDLSALFRGGEVRRGRDDLLVNLVAGEARIVVRDKAGLLNHENASSPLQDLLTGRHQPVRLRGFDPDGVEHKLFYGFLEKLEWTPDRRHVGAGVAVLSCKDLVLWLAEARPIIAATGPTTTGAAIGAVLDAVGWVEPSARSLADGDPIPDFSAGGEKTALALIGELLQAERGLFYVDGAGVAVYEDRVSRTIRTPVAAVADEMRAAVPAVDHSRQRNRVRVKRTQTGYIATATDAASRTVIGDRDLDLIETPYLSSDSQADGLASYILALLARPVAPIRDLKIDNRTAELLEQCLARELGDVVTISAAGAEIDPSDYLIESLQHRITAAGRHETTWLLSEHATLVPFRVGISQLAASEASPGHVLVY